MKKIIILLMIILLNVGIADAKRLNKDMQRALNESKINDGAVAISFKDINSSKTKTYELNSMTPMSPASIQKIVTLIPSLGVLGTDYTFKTQLYKSNTKNEYYLKLGADPYFTSKNLESLISFIPGVKDKPLDGFYIDDSIMDSIEWGEGWQWDDDLNPLMPKFSAYNIDKNIYNIVIEPTEQDQPAKIIQTIFYPTAYMNYVTTGKETNVELSRKNYISPDIITLTGTVSKNYNVKIPINYPRKYFIFRLEEALRNKKVEYYGDFKRMKLPKDVTLVAEISHPIRSAEVDILKYSNNMISETIFKLAGGKYVNSIGSFGAAIEMFDNYCKENGLNTQNIKIADSSGVSKNNLMTADFMTEYLVFAAEKFNYQKFRSMLPTAGEGTLTDRMLYFKDNLRAKTGTLSNVSAIAGYLEAKSGKTYAFCIIINDARTKDSEKKMLEEYLLRAAYNSL